MKNLKMALALLAVVALASPSFAALTLEVTQLADPAPGLTAWMVSGADSAGLLTTVSDMDITAGPDRSGGAGVVHNVWDYASTPTTNVADCAGLAWVPAWTAVDTHTVYDESALILSLGDAITETNDGGNPAGVDVTGPFPGYNGIAGMGTFGQVSGTIAFDETASFDLAQVVLPAGQQVWFNARLVVGGVGTETSALVGVPEPSTIIMLVLGALCLAGYRLRK